MYDEKVRRRALELLFEGLPVPFRLGPDMIRDDDTPRHRAVREALANALTEFRLPGMGGEGSPLVTKVEPPRRDVGNVGNDVGNVADISAEDMIVLFMRDQPVITSHEIASRLGISSRQVERLIKTLRESGRIVREGGTRGYWVVRS